MLKSSYERCIQCITEGRIDDLQALRKNIINGIAQETEWRAEEFMCHASVFSNINAIRYIVNESTVANSENYIICAAIAGSIETIKVLLSIGALVGPSAILNARYYNHIDVEEYLSSFMYKDGK